MAMTVVVRPLPIWQLKAKMALVGLRAKSATNVSTMAGSGAYSSVMGRRWYTAVKGSRSSEYCCAAVKAAV